MFFHVFGEKKTKPRTKQNKTNFNFLGSHEGGRLGGGTGKIARLSAGLGCPLPSPGTPLPKLLTESVPTITEAVGPEEAGI